jgi:hypothetical protein
MATTEQSSLSKGYLATVVGLMLILPSASIAAARFVFASQATLWDLIGEWFLFWGVGVRLATAGLRQSLNPEFTAREIFHLSHPDSHVVVRELGFANVCMGLGAAVSLFVPSWRMCAAFVGGLYFGIAGLMHVIKKPATPNERLALASDLFIVVVVGAWFIHRLGMTGLA